LRIGDSRIADWRLGIGDLVDGRRSPIDNRQSPTIANRRQSPIADNHQSQSPILNLQSVNQQSAIFSLQSDYRNPTTCLIMPSLLVRM